MHEVVTTPYVRYYKKTCAALARNWTPSKAMSLFLSNVCIHKKQTSDFLNHLFFSEAISNTDKQQLHWQLQYSGNKLQLASVAYS